MSRTGFFGRINAGLEKWPVNAVGVIVGYSEADETNFVVFPVPQAAGRGIDRKPQQAITRWPAGTVIVDPDAHWLEEDLWYRRFPDAIKERAPRVQFDGDHWYVSVDGKEMWPREQARAICQQMECFPGINNVAARMADMDAEGIDKQLIFPQRLFGLFFQQNGPADLREHVFKAYNEYMAEVCAKAPPRRLFFVAVPNYWDMTKSRTSIEHASSLGASALMVPVNPRQDLEGKTINYNDPKLDPFWQAVADSGLPVCFHIGENIPSNLPGATTTYVLEQLQGFRKSWGTLVYSGLFDRHPNLKVVFVEAGISWVASMLHDADMLYAAFPPTGYNTFGKATDDAVARQVLRHPPSWYWQNHCYATFMTDPAGLEQLRRIGADRVMWAADYPHAEGTFGYTRDAIQSVFDAVHDVSTAQKILGGTAIEVFNMN
jgi:predicted TIM-barrel fold metal-dependent hydrolase